MDHGIRDGDSLINERNFSEKTNDGRKVKNDRYLKTNEKKNEPISRFYISRKCFCI